MWLKWCLPAAVVLWLAGAAWVIRELMLMILPV